MVHLYHAAKDSRRIPLRTVDTDVVILSVAATSRHPSHEVWVAMGTEKDVRYIAAHQIAGALGPEKSCCLPIFHSFTGCDTVSFFSGVGKKKAWHVWDACEDVTRTFLALSKPPCELTSTDRAALERFVVLCMTGQAIVLMSTVPEDTYSAKKVGRLKMFHPPVRRCCCTQRGPSTKAATFGASQTAQYKLFQIHLQWNPGCGPPR